MKNALILLISLSLLSSCAVFKNKEKNTDNIKTETKEEKTVEESEIDTSTVKTYTKITYGGVSNPFTTPAGIAFTQKLDNLSALNLNAQDLQKAIKEMQAHYKQMLDAAAKENLRTIEEKWTNEQKRKSSTKKLTKKSRRINTKKRKRF